MSYDPTATSATPSLPAAGWYPDPSGGPVQRWWDGTGWTAQTYNPAGAVAQTAPSTVPPGTPVYTVWIWLIVGLQLIGLASLLFTDFDALIRTAVEDSVAQAQDPNAVPDPFGNGPLFTTTDALQSALGFLAYVAGVVFAFLDWRALKQRGFDRPFHWAWAFVPWSLVYVIGRSVVVKRRAGSGLAPIWWYIALTVLTTVVCIAVIGTVLATVLPGVLPSIPTGPEATL